MQLFEGADAELTEAARLYQLLYDAVRARRFYGVPSRLVSTADARCEVALARVAAASRRAGRRELNQIETLNRRAARTRARLERLVDRRSRWVSEPMAPFGVRLDALFQHEPAPTLGWGWRLPVAVGSLVVCIAIDCWWVGNSRPAVLVVLAWLAFVAAKLRASSRLGRAATLLTLEVPIAGLAIAWRLVFAFVVSQMFSGG